MMSFRVFGRSLPVACGPTLQSSLVLILAAASLSIGPVFCQTSTVVVEGPAAGYQLGRTLRAIRDVDGDGYADIASGSPLLATAAGSLAGAVQIRSGRTGVVILTLDGDQGGARFGAALGEVDLDGDGQSELLVGSPLYSGTAGTACGRVRAFSMPSGTPLLTVEGAVAGERFGTSVAGIADVTSDGLEDVIVGAPFFAGPAGAQSGRAVWISGATGSTVVAVNGTAAQDQFGTVVIRLGDIDLDQRDEIAVSAPLHDTGGSNAGRVTIFTPGGGYVADIDGTAANQQFGSSLAGVGDLNADGRKDLVVGAGLAAGTAGSSAGMATALLAPAFTTAAWTVFGPQAGARLGSSVAGAGDQDGDGVPEVVVGSPLHDGVAGFDSGRAVVLRGTDGVALYAMHGSAPFEQAGFAVAGGRDHNFDGRPDVVVGAPFANGTAGAQTGRVRIAGLDPSPAWTVSGYPVGGNPRALAVADGDGDGDADIAVACGDETVHVLWNGNHATSGTTFMSGAYDTIGAAVLNLPPGTQPRSVVMGNLDGDPVGEILVGLSDGRVATFDGTGTTAAPVFVPGPTLDIDPRPGAGPISLALVGAGPSAQIILALAGGPIIPGEVRVLTDPFGIPTVSAAYSQGGSFVAVRAVDMNGDSVLDIVATNSGFGGVGGVHILEGPAYLPAPNSPYSTPAVPVVAVPVSLEPASAMDIIVAELSLSGGGVGVLKDFGGSGFASSTSAGGGLARDVAPWIGNTGDVGIAYSDGLGNLRLLTGWNGASFGSDVPLPVGSGVSDIESGSLNSSPAICNGQELVMAVTSDNAVRVARQRVPHLAYPVPNSGCPAGAPTALLRLTGAPVIGDPTFSVGLTNATPNVLAELALEPIPASAPMAPSFVLFGCGFSTFAFTWDFIPFFTNPAGEVTFPLPLPNDPNFVCLTFLGAWVIHDGGPLFGLTLSDQWVVRVGEY